MFARQISRVQFAVALLVVAFLLASLFVLSLIKFPADAQRTPLLLTVFVLLLVISFLCLIFLLRWLLRPYRQLVGEAERAPVAARFEKSHNEAEFVLQTFQSVVAQLQAQQRELEELSAQASERATSAEAFSERIVASVPSGLIAFDSQGLATVVNAPARALIEADETATGQHVRTLMRYAPELAEMIEGCLATGKLYRREEIAAHAPDGRTRRLGATIAPIDLSTERGALCLLTDLTEVTELREQVALKRNLESLGEMSAGLAHEFKNELAALHGYAQLLQSMEMDERGRVAASALLEEVRNLSEMVTAFLNFARPQPLDQEEVSLGELVRRCAGELSAFFSERRIELFIEGEFPETHADERMLRQAVLNLLRNAAEAIESDKRVRRVIARGARERNASGREFAVIEIIDTGDGIAPEDLQRIFIPFFTTKSKGHGVGLALAHRVITAHGGTLSAANANGQGALFTLKIPASL